MQSALFSVRCFSLDVAGLSPRTVNVISHQKKKNSNLHPVHTEFLLWSGSRVWLEQDLLTERCDLLIEWFASDALMSCITVTANVECRQCPCCMTYQPFQN